MPVVLVNPLPHALAHYARELAACLDGDVVLVEPPAERSDGSLPARTAAQARARLRLPPGGPVVVLWPAFGRLDPATWSLVARRRPVWVVVHDPEPLRAQRGHGRLAAVSERLARRAGVEVVAHSAPAAAVLSAQGWRPRLLPHPVLAPTSGTGVADGPVLVLGQFKPARSLAVLAELAAARDLDGRRVVRGRGWPRLDGWAVEDAFLAEVDFDGALRSARCLVLPYDRYFQSNVAVRALEAGVPVVAARHPFLVELLGADWPGFAEPGGWAAAVDRVAGVGPERIAGLGRDAAAYARAAWTAAVGGGRPPGPSGSIPPLR